EVHMVADPFGLPPSLELEAPEKSNAKLDKIARAMKKEEARNHAELLAETQDPSEKDNALELARQIAEDEQLEREMAAERADAEENDALDPELESALPRVSDDGQMDL